ESGQLFCVATLRSDYLAALQVQPLWQGLAFRNLTLGPMAAEHFVEAITRPAEVAGIELEDGLVDRMLRDTGSADALPLLAFTLNRLWREYGRVDGRITIAEYAERIGGIEGSIRQEAEGVLAALDPTPQQLAELKRAFRLMVRVNEEGQYTRRPVRRAELPAATRPLLEAFVRARLLVSGGEDSNFPDVPATPAGKDAGTLEVAHEALFRAWDTLKDWLDEDRAFLLWRQRVEREENAWRAAPKDQGLLLRGGRLAEAQRWLAERSEDVGAATAAFIRASRALARRIAWIWRGLGAATAVGLVIATVLAVLWWNARQDTLEQLINSYWNIAIAARDGEGDALRAAHYFSRAADLTSNPAERDSALLSAGLLSGGVVLENVFQLEAPPAAVFTAADQPLAVFHMAKEVHLWDLDTGTKLPPLPHSGELKESLVAAEGSVVSWGEGTEIFLWGRGRPTVPLSHEGPVAGALLNRDGTALLSWDEAGTARVWDAATGAQRACFAHPGPVRGARFLDAPGRVLTWNTDAMLRVWHSDQNGPPAACRTEPPLPAWSQSCEDGKLAIHVDGGAALGWCGKNLAVHDLVRGRLMTPPWSSPEPVDGALFLPGGKTVATWNLGAGRVRVWDTQGGTENYPPIEHEGGIHRVLLTPDGERLNTAGEDGRIRSWDVELGEEAARADHTAGRGRVLASLGHSGTRVLGWAEESGARLWDTRTLTPLSLPLGPDGGALGAGFFHQDQQILTWGRDGVVRIWRRQPSLELTASVGRPGTEAAEISATPSVASPAERRAMSEAGLADLEVLARGERSLLLGAGTEARVMTPGVPGTRVSPPLTLDGDILGAVFAAQGDRVALWGESSVRFWDAPSGRPLSALLRSDVLLPAAAKTEDGLLVWDDDGARIWRWTLAVPQTIPSAEAWLQAVSGTRLDARNELRLLTPEEWCEAARKSGRQPAPAACRP
ncbi:MAG: WD40 repeat domain-containing protein, partial [Pseudomonadota bacterium]